MAGVQPRAGVLARDSSRRRARLGDYEVEVLIGTVAGEYRPIAVLVSPWIIEHLTFSPASCGHGDRPVRRRRTGSGRVTVPATPVAR